MITLYISTTTLNFNNILSSESISPKAFYERREFGYRRWAAIEENGIENATILYDKLPSFSRPDNGLEDHPLVVQVVLNENQVKTIGNGVFYCDKTIYLDPWHTKFIFQSERDKGTTLSMSDSSSETKLLHLYRNQLEVRIGQSKYDVPKNSDIILNKREITNDFSFNRIKGLLYGYYIGANMSLSKDDVEEIVEMRELQDILSSIQSSDDHVPSSFQKERLHQLLRLAVNLYDNDIRNGKMLDLAEASVSWSEKTAAQNKKLLLPESNEIEISEGQLSSVKTINDCKEKELFKAWTEYLFSFDSNKYNGKISTIKKELSDELTVIAKGVYGDDWEGSHAKRFLNNLRRHIRGEEFDEQWDNGLLSSIAAVLTHGDDWHKLLSFMQSKGMYDYRLAFALFGILNGFANLTRDFTDFLFRSNANYVENIYTHIYKQIFGKQLSVSYNHPQTGKESLTDDDKINHIRKTVEMIGRKLNLRKQQKDSLKKALDENGNNENPRTFIKNLKNKPGWSKGKNLNAIEEAIGGKGSNSNGGERNQPTFWDNPSQEQNEKGQKTSSILTDELWKKETADFINDNGARTQYLKDIDWFIKKHKESYKDSKTGEIKSDQYYLKDNTNKKIINHLEAFLNRDKNKEKMEWLIPLYQEIPIKKIIDYLRSIYDN